MRRRHLHYAITARDAPVAFEESGLGAPAGEFRQEPPAPRKRAGVSLRGQEQHSANLTAAFRCI
jgi:hypothetical protein